MQLRNVSLNAFGTDLISRGVIARAAEKRSQRSTQRRGGLLSPSSLTFNLYLYSIDQRSKDTEIPNTVGGCSASRRDRDRPSGLTVPTAQYAFLRYWRSALKNTGRHPQYDTLARERVSQKQKSTSHLCNYTC